MNKASYKCQSPYDDGGRMDLEATSRRLEAMIRDVPDFPQPGIIFKDITPILQSPQGLREAIDAMVEPFRDAGIDAIVGLESRGFVFGAPIAYNMGLGFVPVRKHGKLPADKIHIEYDLEYGSNIFEVHRDAITPGQRVLLVDDLLATGGTMRASIDLVEQLGGVVAGLAFMVELGFLNGRDRLQGYDLHALIRA
jgi:adenine phosphoribosyltransferase